MKSQKESEIQSYIDENSSNHALQTVNETSLLVRIPVFFFYIFTKRRDKKKKITLRKCEFPKQKKTKNRTKSNKHNTQKQYTNATQQKKQNKKQNKKGNLKKKEKQKRMLKMFVFCCLYFSFFCVRREIFDKQKKHVCCKG